MSDLPVLGVTAPPSAWKMIRAMVGIGVFCGLLIVAVYQWTLPTIRANRAEALQRAIFMVLPEARSSKTFRLDGDNGFEMIAGEDDGGELVYAGYDDSNRLIGLAIEARGMGYADVIHVIYGYSFAADAIVGMRVLESRETPGLGDRIETDETFQQNFVRLDVSLTEDRSALAHPIEAVKPGKKDHPWQVDGITGATISSVAIAEMLRDSSAYWIPRIRERLDDFEQGEGS